jgi:hypothetical protein
MLIPSRKLQENVKSGKIKKPSLMDKEKAFGFQKINPGTELFWHRATPKLSSSERLLVIHVAV